MGYGRGFTRPVTLPVHTVTGASKVGQVPNTESSKPAASYRERVHGVVPGYAGYVPGSPFKYGGAVTGGVSPVKPQPLAAFNVTPRSGPMSREHQTLRSDRHTPISGYARQASSRDAHAPIPGYTGYRPTDKWKYGGSTFGQGRK
eukprot:CAMPEP_0181212446 /NCGR_PEP_ID=MMETSP1096-20121128/24352_1 /TAXON_ID=156174 ORGANISM="Chrysochromulina ericina, Strain CCMP281" /NCGR_SAMPLE_ID=MMETSP1096 /ASSEMBLY_ACC=CAM_ASM_000453 /LENGTH=144 /DNA_ID=CAMNT_0023303971 /DNA_START=44 /DNA_END=478 /DNA_ORIENTATION=-